MIFLIEFNKILRRKFNYLFGIILVLLSIALTLKRSNIANFYELTEGKVVFDIILKTILILIIFLMGINYIYSYRDDYRSKVSNLLILKKIVTKRDFISVIANVLYFFIYSYILFSTVFVTLYIRERNVFKELLDSLTINNHIIAYSLLLILLFIFANLIFLLTLTLFNNTNIAISLSLLYFVGAGVLSKVLSERISDRYTQYLDNSILNIFDKNFNNLNQYIDLNINNFGPIILNIVGLIIVILIVKVIKKIIA